MGKQAIPRELRGKGVFVNDMWVPIEQAPKSVVRQALAEMRAERKAALAAGRKGK